MAENNSKSAGLFGIMRLPNDNPKKTVFVAILLCLVCSVLVSTAAVMLKPQQQANKKNDIKQNILAVAGISYSSKEQVEQLFKQFEVRLVDFDAGDFANTDIDPVSYDQRQASSDPAQSVKLTADQDVAGIGSRANLAPVYLLKEGDNIKQVVVPVHGYGLWSTLYGFVSLGSDFNTIRGLQFYEHAETPGLGGEVDNPKWRALWKGKKVFDENGDLRITVIRGHVDTNAKGAEYQVDGLSGATLTSNGVTNLLAYWLGDHAFGPFLKQMRSELGN